MNINFLKEIYNLANFNSNSENITNNNLAEKRPPFQRQSSLDIGLTESQLDNRADHIDFNQSLANKSKSAFKLVVSQNSSLVFNNNHQQQQQQQHHNHHDIHEVNTTNSSSPQTVSNTSLAKSSSVKSTSYSSTSSSASSSSSAFIQNNSVSPVANTGTNDVHVATTSKNERAIGAQDYE